ncbi:MAG: 50S ribosomal protein L21 [Candidatus Sumerlaeia bacterium]
MFAVIRAGGKQYRVTEGDTLKVDRMDGEAGGSVRLEDVLMVQDEGGTRIGTPTVPGAFVECTIVQHGKGKKVRVYKYKPKKDSEKTIGFRRQFTQLRVEKIVAG